jgi:hypothetical protein
MTDCKQDIVGRYRYYSPPTLVTYKTCRPQPWVGLGAARRAYHFQEQPEARGAIHKQWSDWWAIHGTNATIYDPETCGITRQL